MTEPLQYSQVQTEPLSRRWVASTWLFLVLFGASVLISLLTLDNIRLRGQLMAARLSGGVTLEAGAILPDEDVGDGTGSTLRIRQLMPSGGVVFFFTTTCPYCEASIDFLDIIRRAGDDAGLGFVAASLGERAATVEYARGRPALDSLVIVPASSVTARLVKGVPLIVLIDSAGQVLRTWRGELDVARAQEVARQVLRVRSAPERRVPR